MIRGSDQDAKQKEFERQCEEDTRAVANRGQKYRNGASGFFSVLETGLSWGGEPVIRVKTSIFIIGAVVSIFLGVVLLLEEIYFGAFMVITLAPFLLLYPVVRFLFGGKDSIGVAALTAVTEELIKSEVIKKIEKRKKKRK